MSEFKLVPVSPTAEMKDAVRAKGGNQAVAFALAAWPDMLAAAPAALKSGRVTVKALEWEPGVVIWARPLPGMKYVVATDHRSERCSWWLESTKDSRGVCATEAEAKAAAQADFESRILAEIETAPTPSPDQSRRSKIRRAALRAIERDQLRDRAERAEADAERLRDALRWCSGSADFCDGGQAHEGWMRVCQPLLNAYSARAVLEGGDDE